VKGKTPEATISAMLAVGAKPGGPFKRVEKGTYTLADPAATAARPSSDARARSGAKASARTKRTSKTAP